MPLDCYKYRRANLLILIRETGGIDALAARTLVTASALQRVLSGLPDHRMGQQMARQLERRMGKRFGWMDRASGGPTALREGLHPSVVYGIAGARRQWLLRLLMDDSLKQVARRIQVDALYLQQVAEGRLPFESALARQVEQALAQPEGWLDDMVSRSPAPPTAFPPPQGGDDSRGGI